MPPIPAGRHRFSAVAPALGWVAFAAMRLIGAERGFPLVPAMALTPYAAAGAALPLGMSVARGHRRAAVLAASAGALLGVMVLRRAGSGADSAVGGAAGSAAGTGRLRVACVSLRLGLADTDDVLELVRRHGVDVLAVQELTPPAERRLHTGGIGGLLPHAHVVHARPGRPEAAGGAVFSRLPITARDLRAGGFEQPVVRLALPGGPEVEVTAVHITPPSLSPAAVRGWAADLATLPQAADDVLRVLAGDFNATLDHAAFRAVLRGGYVDAARAAGRALAATWRPLFLPHPRLTLDHVLVDPRLGVAAVEVVPVAGSDHRAVVAELVLPDG